MAGFFYCCGFSAAHAGFMRSGHHRIREFSGSRRELGRQRWLRVEMLEKRELMAADAGVIGIADAERPLLLAEGEATTPIVQYAIRTLAPGTDTPITSILAGRDFDLQVRVRDLRIDGNKSRGVYAAFLDVLYDKSLANVRVAEMQRLLVAGALSGTFRLSMGPGQTTEPITYDLNSSEGAAAFRGLIETALNNLLGAGTVQVTSHQGDYLIRFTGQYDFDFPDLTSDIDDILVFEGIKGDPTSPESFIEAFRSFDIGLNNGLPGLYQVSLSAIDAADRIDELGAQVALTTARNNLTEVTRGRVKALLPGNVAAQNLVFTPDFTQMVRPIHNTLVLADINATPPEDSLVPNELITALPVTLVVEAPLFGTPITATVDEDSLAGVTIPILPHVTKHAAAPAGAKELRSFTQPAGGVVTRIDPNNTPADQSDDLLKFVPSPNFNGTTNFTYLAGIVGDSSPYDTASNTVSIIVNPINDAPVISSFSFAGTNEDTALVLGSGALSVSDVDADPDGVQVTLSATYGSLALASTQGLTVINGGQPASPTLTFLGTTSSVNAALAGLTYHPPPNFNGQDMIKLIVNDQGNSGSGGPQQRESTMVVNVVAVNDKPTLVIPPAQTVYSVNKLTFSPAFHNSISVYDIDAAFDSISVAITATGGIGTLSAATNFGAQVSGNDTVSLTITGNQYAINSALATLVLTPSAGNANGALSITVNDQQHNPGPNLSAQGQIGVTVTVPTGPFGVNDVPGGLLEGSASYVIDVLANDLTNGTAKAALKSVRMVSGGGTVDRFDTNGTPNDSTDDKIIYRPPLKNGQPDLDFFVPESQPPIVIAYTINEVPETLPDSAEASVSLRILNVADVPVAVNDGTLPLYATTIGESFTRTATQGLLINDTNIDNTYGDPTAVALMVAGAEVGAPLTVATSRGGTATIQRDGSFTYTPMAGFQGNDTFTYRAQSSSGPNSDPATVTIRVLPIPTAVDDSFVVLEDTPLLGAVLGNDSDPVGGEALSALLVTNVPESAGLVTLDPAGFLTYHPAANFFTPFEMGPIFFTYQATTPSGRKSAVATVSIWVNAANDKPVAVDDEFRAARNNGVLGIDQLVPVLGNDNSGPDAPEELVVVGVNGAVADGQGNSTAIATAGGGIVRLEGFQIKYTSPQLAGPDSFSYTIRDEGGAVASGTVQVNVAPIYDYGDAADSYATSFTANGPRHLATGPRLGDLRDEELDAAMTAAASGDDSTASDDEDGLVSTSLVRGKQSSVILRVAGANSATLDAWIDYDRDGQFAANEKISDSATIPAGDSLFAFTVPATAQIGQAIARFRVSSVGGLSPTGVATDGEVEDHVVTIVQDLEVDLPTGVNANRISIRKSGSDMQVYDLASNSELTSNPLVLTRGVIVRGSQTQADEITVDYAFGGFFVLPGGIHLEGGASSGDALIIQGATGGMSTVHYVSQGLSLGNARVETADGAEQNDVVFTGFEPLSLIGMDGFTVEGALNIGNESLDLGGLNGPINLGPMTTLTGGTLTSPAGVSLTPGQTLRGEGTLIGPINALAGSLIEATGPLTLGDPDSPTGFSTQGELRTGGNSVTLKSASPVSLGTLTTLGAESAAGTLIAPSGLLLGATSVVSGFGTVDTPLDSAKALINNGAIQGESATEPITLSGYVAGIGTLDNVLITGILSPGASPATVSYGSVEFGAAAQLVVEIGGESAGEYDQLKFSGLAKLNGKLKLVFINGYVPDYDDAFSFLQAGQIGSGFNSVELPSLVSDKKWKTSLSGNQFSATAVTMFPWHNRRWKQNVDDDHVVSASDVVNIINYINGLPRGYSGAVPENADNVKPFRDVDKDNFVTASDVVSIINYINAGFGDSPPQTTTATAFEGESASSVLNEMLDLIAADIAESVGKKK
jgi:hypothetical protein